MWMIEFVFASEQSDYSRVTATRQRPVNFRIADKPSGGELITGFERYGDLSPTIGFVLRLHVRESIQ
jgi:hypothetical protein